MPCLDLCCPKKTFKLVNNVLVYLSQTVDNDQEAVSQRIGILLQRMAVFHLLFYITIKEEDLGGLHEIHCW